MDPWTGPFVVQEQVGKSMVKCLNLETKWIVYIDLNDLHCHKSPDTDSWILEREYVESLCVKLGLEFHDFASADLNETWKNKDLFVDVCMDADLEVVFAKALKVQPRRLLIVVPGWKEKKFYEVHSTIDDSDTFLNNGDPTEFRITARLVVME